MKAIVRNDFGYLRVRATPSKEAVILGVVQGGLTVEVISVTDNWAMVPLGAGGAPMTIEETDQPTVGYMWAPMLDFSPQTPTPAASKIMLGVHSMTNGRGVDEANKGCRFVMSMNNLGVAEQIKSSHPDAVVMVRRYFGNNVPPVNDAIRALGGARNPGLVYTGLNESDAIGQDGDALRRRAQFDVEMARAVKQASGATYAAGSFSMGTPDFTSPKTNEIIRTLYAPHYNSGLLKMDMHLYSPNMGHINDANGVCWYERRWEFLFTKCGFNPTVKGIYCSETGVDEFGRGGFPGHGTNQADFLNWCKKFIAVQQKPLVVNGTSYSSPFIGAAIFQLGGNGDPRWDSYEINSYLPTLRTLY